MKCSYKGNFSCRNTKKRRLIGSEKNKALAEILDGKISSSIYVRNEACRIMKEGIYKHYYV